MPDIALYTIPHTGTRFVASFLRHVGVPYSQRHVGGDRVRPEGPKIVTVRDPFQTYLSHRHKNEPQTDVEFVSLWGAYILRTYNSDCFYFPLDVPEDNRRILLQRLVQFAGYEPDMDRIDSFEWAVVGRSKRDRSEECPEQMKAALGFAREWYEHFTVFWGPYIRNPQNLLGEGP